MFQVLGTLFQGLIFCFGETKQNERKKIKSGWWNSEHMFVPLEKV